MNAGRRHKQQNLVASAGGDDLLHAGLPDAHREALIWLVRGGTWCRGR